MPRSSSMSRREAEGQQKGSRRAAEGQQKGSNMSNMSSMSSVAAARGKQEGCSKRTAEELQHKGSDTAE